MLSELKKSNIKIAIGSCSKNAKTILKQIELTDAFDVIIDGNDITKSKPDPEVFVLAAQRLGFASNDCIVVEDAMAGIEAGHNGGFDTAAVKDARNSSFATYKLNSIIDILKIISE